MTFPPWALPAYAVASAAALLVHGIDKAAAIRGRRRIPERTLHIVELLGGWPGGLAASFLFRHKTRKPGFLVVRGAVILLHAVLWALWFASDAGGGLARR